MPKNMKTSSILLAYFSIVVLGVFLRGNSWAGAKFDYKEFYLPLVYYLSDNANLPKIEEYGVATFPFWPVLGAAIFRTLGSESAIIALQLIVGFVSVYLVYLFSSRIGYSSRNSTYFALAYSSSIYVASGSLNATTDVPAYCLVLISLILLDKANKEKVSWREYSYITISLFLLIGIRQIYLWIVVIVYAFEIRRLGIQSFLRKYWISIFSNTIMTLYFINYFGNSLVPKPIASISKLSFPAFVNLGIISFISIMFLLPLFYFQIKTLSKSRIFLLSTISLLLVQLIFMKNSILPLSQLSNYQYGWPNVWMKFDGFGYIFPAISTSVFLGFLIFAFRNNYLLLSTKMYFFGLISSGLMISQPFTRYFEIPVLFGLILLLKDCKYSIKSDRSKRLEICVFFIFAFELVKTLITII